MKKAVELIRTLQQTQVGQRLKEKVIGIKEISWT
jgi:hypothetical protein